MDKKLVSRIAIYYTFLLIILSLIPIPDSGIPKFKLFELDKLIHFFMYLFFAIIWGLNSKNFIQNRTRIFFYAVLFGLGLEIFQHVLHFGRYFDWGDFVANSVGVLFGVFILYYIKKKLL